MWKLKHHPSIVVWAGNNENEAALATDWYNTTDHFDRYKQDYINLYIRKSYYFMCSPLNCYLFRLEIWM